MSAKDHALIPGRRATLPTLLLAGALAACAGPPAGQASVPCPDPTSWTTLTADHLRRYPIMEVADAYKLLFHATLGAEHMAPTVASATEWLERELATMGEGPDEPLQDPLGLDGRFSRVHLRPFQAAGGEVEQLARSFVEAAAATPDTAALRCALAAVAEAAAAGGLSWGATEVAEYFAAREREQFPAVHHSEAFRAAYRPAYRVVVNQLTPERE